MDVKQRPAEEVRATAGQSFVQRIGPAGCVLFIALAVLVTAICLTSGRYPIPGYTPPESAAYYTENPEALLAELTENVFPALPEYDMTAAVEDGAVVVSIDSDHFVVGRAALLRYFDEDLITILRK